MNLFGIDDRRYRWVVVAVCFLISFIGLGFCSGTKPLYLAPITNATGIKRSLFSLSDSCRYVTTAVVNLFFGTMLLRFGARRLVAAGFVCLVAFTMIYATATEAWMFCIGGMFLGLGMSWMSTAMIGHVISAWFRENRGTVMGIALASNGLGTAVATQIVSPIINQPDNAFGYRQAYIVTAVLLAAAAVIVLVFFREYPSQDERSAAKTSKKRGPSWIGIEAKEAFRCGYFYAGALCVFLTGMCLQGIYGINAAHMRDVGLENSFIAITASLHSITLSFSKMLVGYLHDRIHLRRTLTLCCLVAVIAIMLLFFVSTSTPWIALVFSPMMSLALPLETIMLPLLAAGLFGERSFEKMMGILVSVSTAGFAVGAPISNLSHDLLGSYRPVIITMACVMVCVTVAYQFILRASEKKRAAVEAQAAETDI